MFKMSERGRYHTFGDSTRFVCARVRWLCSVRLLALNRRGDLCNRVPGISSDFDIKSRQDRCKPLLHPFSPDSPNPKTYTSPAELSWAVNQPLPDMQRFHFVTLEDWRYDTLHILVSWSLISTPEKR